MLMKARLRIMLPRLSIFLWRQSGVSVESRQICEKEKAPSLGQALSDKSPARFLVIIQSCVHRLEGAESEIIPLEAYQWVH